MNALVMILALSFVSTTASPTLELRSLSAECIALLAASPSPTHPSLIAETYLKLIAGFSLPLLQQLLVDPTLVPLASSGVIHVNQGNALRSIIRDYILKLNPSDKNACLQEIRLRIAELLKQPQIDREVSPPLPPTPSRESFISKLDLDQRVQPAFSHDRKFMVFQRGHDLVVEALDGSQVPQIFDSTPLRAARVPNFECLNFSADDRYITAIHDMQMVTVWDRQTGRLASSVDVKRWAYLAILSTDHSKIWVRTSIGVFAFHLKDGNQSAKISGEYETFSLIPSPRGDLIMVANKNHWDSRSLFTDGGERFLGPNFYDVSYTSTPAETTIHTIKKKDDYFISRSVSVLASKVTEGLPQNLAVREVELLPDGGGAITRSHSNGLEWRPFPSLDVRADTPLDPDITGHPGSSFFVHGPVRATSFFYKNTIRVWTPELQRIVELKPLPEETYKYLDMSPNGKYVVFQTEDDQFHIWNLEINQRVVLPFPPSHATHAWSTDGELLWMDAKPQVLIKPRLLFNDHYLGVPKP